MAVQHVPDDIRDFILKHIMSVAQIEALLLIWCSPDERWGLAEVASRIYTSEVETAKALRGLCNDGFLVCSDGVFRLNASDESAATLRNLQEVYRRHLIAVTDIIHRKSHDAGSSLKGSTGCR